MSRLVVVTGGAKGIGLAVVQRFATGRTEAESRTALSASSPLGRLLEPGEVADAIVFLAPPASAAINGQAVVVDGGGVQA